MKALPINSVNQSFTGYRDLSRKIMSSNRQDLINIAEYFHTATGSELKQITGSNPAAMGKLMGAIECVLTRKRCYIADGASFCKQRAEELDKKAAERSKIFAIA